MSSIYEPRRLPSAEDSPPLPPPELDQWTLPLLSLPPMALYRGHAAHHDPLHFNTRNGRWTSPDGAFGTLYVAVQPECAFIEAVGHQSFVSTGAAWIMAATLRSRCLCEVSTSATLRVVDLTHGAALTSLAADSRITNGPHAISRQWAQAFYAHPALPDGVRYRSRRAPEQFCVALFDRAAAAIHADCRSNILRDPVRLGVLLDALNLTQLP